MVTNQIEFFPGLVPVKEDGLYLVTEKELFSVPKNCVGLIGLTKYKQPTAEDIADELTNIAHLIYFGNGREEEYFSQLEKEGAEVEQVIQTIKEYAPEFQNFLANGAEWVVKNIIQSYLLFTVNESLSPEMEYLRIEHFHLEEGDIPAGNDLIRRVKQMPKKDIQGNALDIWHADFSTHAKEPFLLEEELRNRIRTEEVYHSKAIRLGNLMGYYPKEELCFLLPLVYDKVAKGMPNIYNDSPGHTYELLWNLLQYQGIELQEGMSEHIAKEEEKKEQDLAKQKEDNRTARMKRAGIGAIIDGEKG